VSELIPSTSNDYGFVVVRGSSVVVVVVVRRRRRRRCRRRCRRCRRRRSVVETTTNDDAERLWLLPLPQMKTATTASIELGRPATFESKQTAVLITKKMLFRKRVRDAGTDDGDIDVQSGEVDVQCVCLASRAHELWSGSFLNRRK